MRQPDMAIAYFGQFYLKWLAIAQILGSFFPQYKLSVNFVPKMCLAPIWAKLFANSSGHPVSGKAAFQLRRKDSEAIFCRLLVRKCQPVQCPLSGLPQISGAIVAQQSRLTCPIKNPQIVSPFKTLLRTGDLCKRVKLFYLNVSNFARLRSQRPLHVQGDAGLPG
jgi:hypothetical protein